MKKSTVFTDYAPAAIGPYSQGVRAGGFLFVSGQMPMNPVTGELERGDIEAQTEQVLTNLKAILEAAGTDLDHVVKTTVFISDMKEFGNMNAVYARYFIKEQPARSCVEVARLPKDVGVEIEAVALLKRED